MLGLFALAMGAAVALEVEELCQVDAVQLAAYVVGAGLQHRNLGDRPGEGLASLGEWEAGVNQPVFLYVNLSTQEHAPGWGREDVGLSLVVPLSGFGQWEYRVLLGVADEHYLWWLTVRVNDEPAEPDAAPIAVLDIVLFWLEVARFLDSFHGRGRFLSLHFSGRLVGSGVFPGGWVVRVVSGAATASQEYRDADQKEHGSSDEEERSSVLFSFSDGAFFHFILPRVRASRSCR